MGASFQAEIYDKSKGIISVYPAKSLLYRYTFPLDGSLHLTVHRSQGATMRDYRVLVDVGLNNPSDVVPKDAAKLTYVAISRSTALKWLFLDPIATVNWMRLNKDESDKQCIEEEKQLEMNARKFAVRNRIVKQVEDEFSWKPDFTCNEAEYQQLLQVKDLPAAIVRNPPQFANDEFHTINDGIEFDFILHPTGSIRYIGLDQGINNFALTAVDKHLGQPAKLVYAKLITDLELALPDRPFKAEDVVLALKRNCDLFTWMQIDEHSQPPSGIVERVMVCVERMSDKNCDAKAFGCKLAEALQRQCPDITKCIVKMSSPNLHCSGGVLSCMGQRTQSSLNFTPMPIIQVKHDVQANRRKRKQYSSDFFYYLIKANSDRLSDMRLEVDEDVRKHFINTVDIPGIKLDDLGDSVLHALHDLFCGSANFRQAVSAKVAMHSNRTVILSVFPARVYWCVVSCGWNAFVIEAVGSYTMPDDGVLYKTEKHINKLLKSINQHKVEASRELGVALKSFDGCTMFQPTDHIKCCIKQQGEFHEAGFTSRNQAGALTNSTVFAIRKLCDNVMGNRSYLVNQKDKKQGVTYVKICRDRGFKYQVIRSTGKHTNAVLSCLNWFQQHLTNYVEQRKLHLSEKDKNTFFCALQNVAKSGSANLEQIHINERTKHFLCADNVLVTRKVHVRYFTDLILIGINNLANVKAAAANYRKASSKGETVSAMTGNGLDDTNQTTVNHMTTYTLLSRPTMH